MRLTIGLEVDRKVGKGLVSEAHVWSCTVSLVFDVELIIVCALYESERIHSVTPTREQIIDKYRSTHVRKDFEIPSVEVPSKSFG